MRKALVLVGVVVLSVLATGCFGPVSTHTVDVTMTCSATIGPGPTPNHPYADETAHISMDVPAWANPGETIPLSHITVTGLSFPAEGGTVPAGAVPGGTRVDFEFSLPTAGTSFILSKPANSDGSLPTDLGSTSVTIPTGASGTYAIRLLSVGAGWFSISGGVGQTNSRLCLPKTADAIATVSIQGSPVTTAQTN